MRKKIVGIIGVLLLVLFLAPTSFGASAPFPFVDITVVSQTPDPIEANSIGELRFRVRNLGNTKVQDVQVELVEEYPIILLEPATKNIGNLEGYGNLKDSDVVVYRIKTAPDAPQGEHEMTVRYTTASGEFTETDFDFRIQTRDIALSIEEVSNTPVSPGEEFSLRIKLKNVADSIMRNIRFKLDLFDIIKTTTGFQTFELPFTPVGTSNEKVVEQLDSGEEIELSFPLVVDGDAVSKTYKVPISVIFSDHLGGNFTKDNVIGIIVDEEPDVYLSIDGSEIIRGGNHGEVNVKITNKGVSDIKFFNLELKESEDFTILSAPVVYVGNIDSDDYENADFSVYVDNVKGSTVTLPLAGEYRDANNDLHTITAELDLSLYSKKEAQQYGLEEKSSKVGLVIFVVIIVAGYLLYRRWKKNKK